jgi:SpoVK/Ycf46/Vps4 family AAA+-type ATPase
MNVAAESIQKMILAHFKGDEVGFRAAVEEYIADERRKNHHVLVKEMEQTLSKSNGSTHRRVEVLSLLGIQNDSLPRDKERGAVLVEVKEAVRRLDGLVLKPEIRAVLDRVVVECKNRDLLGSYGIQPVRKILFCGPPGCGKTVAAEALAKALYLPLTTVRFDAVVSSYLGETAANLRKVFDFGRTRPMALFFDEFDAIGKHRTADDEHGELKRVVNSFLQLLDAFRGETITIAATNHQGLLDSALWRRFD